MDLLKLDYTFDAGLILNELIERKFVPHFMQEWAGNGNSALLLVTTNGEENHRFDDPMLPTPDLEAMPYTRSIWDTLNIPLIRSRFMQVAPGGVNQLHIDSGKWWRDKLRIHIPVKTNPKAKFICGDKSVHMKAGDCWLVNTSEYYHSAINDGDEPRTHLVIDVKNTFTGN